jgi:hypothetical protein
MDQVPASIGVDFYGDSLVLELPRAFRWRLGYALLAVLVAPLAGGIPRQPAEWMLFALVWLGIGLWVVLGLTRRQVRVGPGEIALALYPPWGGERIGEIAWNELQSITIERTVSGWPYPCSGLALVFRSTQETAFGHGLWRHELEWVRGCLLDQLGNGE